MLSSVFLTGTLGEWLDEKHVFRYVLVERITPTENTYVTDKFIVKAALGEDCYVCRAKVGSYIALKGRLETDPTYGLIIVDEIEEIYQATRSK